MDKFDINVIFEWPLWLQALLLTPIIFLVFYFFYFFDYAALNIKLADSQRQEEDLKQQLDLLFKQQIKLQNELKQLPLLQAMLDEWKKKLTTSSQIPALLDEVLKIATVHGVTFSQVEPGKEIKDNGYLKIPVKILAQGQYHQLSEFIAQIATMPKLLVVESLSITKPQKKSQEIASTPEQMRLKNRLESEMLLTIYSDEGGPAE